MIFTQLARIVAVLALVFGIVEVLLGIGIASGAISPYEEALARYAPGASSSGQVVDRGIYVSLFAIGLGTVAEIGLSMRKRSS